MLLGKEQILAAKDLQYEDIDVPEWGGTVRVRVMTGSERDSFEQSIMKSEGREIVRDMANMRAKLLVRTICDENNKRIFTDKEINLLGEKSASGLEKVFELAQRLNKLGATSVEDAEKNLEGGVSDSSISPSPANLE
jgi:hypothetical protein